jgi:hypothetical protein
MILRNSEFSNHEVIVDNIKAYIDLFGGINYNDRSTYDYSSWSDVQVIIETLIPDIERKILTGIYYEYRSFEEIGKELNISKRNVQTYKNRALFRIKTIYQLLKHLSDAKIFLTKYCQPKTLHTMHYYVVCQSIKTIADKLQLIEGRRLTEQAIGNRINKEIQHLKEIEINSEDKKYRDAFIGIIDTLKKNPFIYTNKEKRA